MQGLTSGFGMGSGLVISPFSTFLIIAVGSSSGSDCSNVDCVGIFVDFVKDSPVTHSGFALLLAHLHRTRYARVQRVFRQFLQPLMYAIYGRSIQVLDSLGAAFVNMEV